MRVRRFLTGFFLAAIALAAYAFERPFPTTATRGTMRPALHPEIVIDGKLRHLAPGARIWNQDNLMELPQNMLPGQYIVNYTVDSRDEIDRVWMLTEAEAKLAPPTPQKNRSD
ncbi:hypothetical protein BH11PSE11_BH11PSE11_29530 [soil metagenome]